MSIWTSNVRRTHILSLNFVEEQQYGVLGQITKKNSFGIKKMESPKNDILHQI